MQQILGIILRDSNTEILESEAPGKGSYMGLLAAMIDARRRFKEGPNVKQINVYSIKQGQRILDHQLFPETIDEQFKLMNNFQRRA